MTNRIIYSTEELQRIQQAEVALTTYSNYVKAWAVGIGRVFGADEEAKTCLVEGIIQHPNYAQIHRITPVGLNIRNAYIRSRLTQKALDSLPIDTSPELAKVGNMWLPVQSYYTIHGIGSALIIALRMTYTDTHANFLTLISQVMERFMPVPFCGRCVGGPSIANYEFENLVTSADDVKNLVHLGNPQDCESIDDFIGKTLSTTRTEFLEKRYESTRKSQGKKRLSAVIKERCCENEHPTSIVDFLYRLRCRSNYDNPDMYLYSGSNEAAIENYDNLKMLTSMMVTGFETLLEKALGIDQMTRLREDIE